MTLRLRFFNDMGPFELERLMLHRLAELDHDIRKLCATITPLRMKNT